MQIRRSETGDEGWETADGSHPPDIFIFIIKIILWKNIDIRNNETMINLTQWFFSFFIYLLFHAA